LHPSWGVTDQGLSEEKRRKLESQIRKRPYDSRGDQYEYRPREFRNEDLADFETDPIERRQPKMLKTATFGESKEDRPIEKGE